MILWQNEDKSERIDALTRLVLKRSLALSELNRVCREYDKTFSGVETEPGYRPDRHFKSFFLYYEGEKLAGELFLFLTGENCAEITAIVDPASRRRGIFTKLLGYACEELDRYGIKERFFVAEPDCRAAKGAIEHLGLVADHYELEMEYEDSAQENTDHYELEMEYEDSVQENTDHYELEMEYEDSVQENTDLYEIEMEYEDSAQENTEHIETDTGHKKTADTSKNSKAKNCSITFDADENTYHAIIENSEDKAVISVANAYIAGPNIYIYGVETDERYRRQGYGRKIMAELIERLKEDLPGRNIRLQVSSLNIPASDLYRNIGFKTVSGLEYLKSGKKGH